MEEQFTNACKNGDIKLINELISTVEIDLDNGLDIACRFGELEVAKIMLDKRVEIRKYHIVEACLYGYKEIVELLLNHESYFDRFHFKLDYYLSAACKSKNKEILELLIKHGANNFRYALADVIGSRDIELIKLIISKGPNLNDGLEEAVLLDDIEIVELLILNGATERFKKTNVIISKINRKNFFNLINIPLISDITSIIYQFIKIS